MSWIDLAQYGFISQNRIFLLVRASRIENVALIARDRAPDQLRIRVYAGNHEYASEWFPQSVAQDHIRRLVHALGHREAISFAAPAPMEEDNFDAPLGTMESDVNYPVELPDPYFYANTTQGGSRS
jgi:hypothetical protein